MLQPSLIAKILKQLSLHRIACVGGKKVFKTAGPEQSPTVQRQNNFQASVLLAAFIVIIIYILCKETVCIQKISKIIIIKKGKKPNQTPTAYVLAC